MFSTRRHLFSIRVLLDKVPNTRQRLLYNHIPLNPTHTFRHHDTAVMRSLLCRTSVASKLGPQNDAADINRVLTVIVSHAFGAREANSRSPSGARC